ncbi:MAG: PAS domain S-box protein [Ignavibacteria bacterium]|nr:PAS domain S-box protein [Ignavibacteria bacterium]
MPKKKTDNSAYSFLPVDSLPIGIVIFDNDLVTTSINSALFRMGVLNQSISEDNQSVNLLETRLFDYVDLAEDLLKVKDGIAFEREIRRISSGKRNISLICKCVPLYSDDDFSGGLIIVEDLRVIPELVMSTNLHYEKTGDILSSLYDLVFITKDDGKILFYGGRQVFKYLSESSPVLKESVFSLLKLNPTSIKVTELQSSTLIELKKDRELHFLNLKSIPFFDADEKPRILFTLDDVSHQEMNLKSLEKQIGELSTYAVLAEKGGLAIFSVNKKKEIVSWSKEAENFFGYKKLEVFNKNVSLIINHFPPLLKGGVFRSLYNSAKNTGLGEFRLIENIDSQGGATIICRDIFEEEKEKRALQLTNRQLRTFLNSSEDLICEFDNEGRIIKANERFYSILSYDSQKRDLNLNDLFTDESIVIDQVRTSGIQKRNLRAKTSTGRVFPAEVTFVYFEEDETFSSFACLIRDISSREKTTQDILLMQSIFEASNDGIAVEEADSLIFVNNSFVRIFGYDSELEIIGKSFNSFIHPVDDPLNSTEGKEFNGVKKDGNAFIAEVSRASFEFNNKTFNVLIVRDITQMRLARKLIEESEAKYRSIAENIDDFLWVSEIVENRLSPVFVTSSFVAMTGFKVSEFVGNNHFWFRIIHPEDLDGYFLDLKNLLRNKYKNGGALECRIIAKNGASIWVKNKISFVREGDKIVKMFGLVSDITKQKQAEDEINQSTENLKKLNEAKDRFISIISHDMRTPFSSILGFTDFLLSEEMSPEEMKKYITYIQDSTKIMLGLVNSLLDWTRLQTGKMKFEPVKQNLHLIVSKSFSAVSGTALQKNITLQNNIPEEVVVFVDQNLVLQVFNNLFSNAIKFTPKGGLITAGITGKVEGRFLEVFVRDTGVGIKKGDLDKVFKVDTKFTTVGTAGEKGTGLGLSLVKEIVEKHGGSIDLTSKEGEGTTFNLSLPIASSRIALVESSATDRVLYAKIISNLLPGYEVDQFKDIESAAKSIINSVPALVISGHSFDERTGLDLIKSINSSFDRARIPVIILGNGLGKSENIAYSEAGAEAIFNKPVNLQKFKEAILNAVKTIFTLKPLNK